MEKTNFHDLITKQSSHRGDDCFLTFRPTGEVISYKKFDSLTLNAACGFLDAGITKGDRIALMLGNSVEFLIGYFGALRMGAITVPMNPSLKITEINNILHHSQAQVLVAENTTLDLVRQLDQQDLLLDKFITPIELRSQSDNTNLVLPEVDPNDWATILYTSGTTGDPKGVVLTQWNLIINAVDIGKALGFQNDRMMCVLPLHHTNGQVINILMPFIYNGDIVLCESYNALTMSDFWETVWKYSVTVIDVVPTILSMLLHLKSKITPLSYTKLKYIICGAAPLPTELQRQFEDRFLCTVIQEYGLTEGTCVSSINSLAKNKVGSIGLPLANNEIRIANEDDSATPVGEIGEILIKGENVMMGYYKRPDLTQEVIIDGWLHTGDLGRADQDGFIYIVGRKKDIIIKGGENIYPIDIENILCKHPAVSECVVVGIADPIYGENAKAYVVLKDNVNITAKLLIGYCRDNLPNFWCPTSIEFIDRIPRTASGKVIKRHLISSS